MPTSSFYHNEKPIFHSSMSSHGGLTLFLDFNKKDILQGMYFLGTDDSTWFEELSSLAKEVEGKNFEELQTHRGAATTESFFDLPRFLLKDALDSYRGKAPALCELKGQPEEDLICRCFGIYKEELLEALEDNPEYGPRDLTNATKAGAGCSTCLSDFSEVLAEGKSRQAQKLLNK